MTVQLVGHPADTGEDLDELLNVPGAIREVHEDTLRHLMETDAPIERVRVGEVVNRDHPRRRRVT